MGYVIAILGEKSKKRIVGGGFETKQSFVGANEHGQVGIGLRSSNKTQGSFSFLSGPGRPIQAWRAIKILAQTKYHKSSDLEPCLNAAGPNPTTDTINYLADQFGSKEKFYEVRNEVLASAPSGKELYAILTILREYNIIICDTELGEELGARKINSSRLIRKIIKEADAQRINPHKKGTEEASEKQKDSFWATIKSCFNRSF